MAPQTDIVKYTSNVSECPIAERNSVADSVCIFAARRNKIAEILFAVYTFHRVPVNSELWTYLVWFPNMNLMTLGFSRERWRVKA